jgi:hypothetical protein
LTDPLPRNDHFSSGPKNFDRSPLTVHVLVGDDAEVVLRERVAVAVADPAEVLGLDVRDAVRGAADVRVEATLRGGHRGQGAEHDGEQDEQGTGATHRPDARPGPPGVRRFAGATPEAGSTVEGMSHRLIGVVVHPRRPLDKALAAVHAWAGEQGWRIGQVPVAGQDRRVAEVVRPEDCGLLLAMGGDGTVLAALHAAAPAGVPVLGVACGSLGALTSVKAPEVATALGRFAAGDWDGRSLPAISVSRDGEELGSAFNDLVVVRNGAGQVILDVQVDGRDVRPRRRRRRRRRHAAGLERLHARRPRAAARRRGRRGRRHAAVAARRIGAAGRPVLGQRESRRRRRRLVGAPASSSTAA